MAHNSRAGHGYFLTGFRHLVGVVAGATKRKITAFALFAQSGAQIWSLTLISLGYLLGDKILGACNRHVAHRALQTEDNTGVMLLCYVIVQEAEGGKGEVAAVDRLHPCRLSITLIFGTLLNSQAAD